ncbi:MAG: hypothetical protein QOH19_1965 [Actinomycetota bacterium]|jgi:acetyl esterase/lipase|nr:hypothetical protein [Actinomycetota bacterium]
MPAAGGDATLLSDAENMELGTDGRIELRAGDNALVIHSEDDLRCPVEQGQRYFTALKQRAVETAFLVFPGENHELSRSGTPHTASSDPGMVGPPPSDDGEYGARRHP